MNLGLLSAERRAGGALASTLLAVALVGCAGVSGSASPSVAPVTSPGPVGTAVPKIATAPSPRPTPAGPSASTCVLPTTASDWIPIPSGVGRCTAPSFDPPLSFVPGNGWLWAPSDTGFAMTRDNGATFLDVYRYGGAVVPPYCVDPPKTIAMSATEDVVAWVRTVPGLQVQVTDRTVGTHRAWQLDLAAVNPPTCSPGKQGLVSLWTKAGAPIKAPEALSGGDKIRVYLIEVSTGIVVLRVSAQPEPSSTTSLVQFLAEAERLFASLQLP